MQEKAFPDRLDPETQAAPGEGETEKALAGEGGIPPLRAHYVAVPGRRMGWSCSPRRAASTVSSRSVKSAWRERGLRAGSSWPKGTKKTFFRFSSRPMFSAEPESPSLVEKAYLTFFFYILANNQA